jgi:hypothetical protein
MAMEGSVEVSDGRAAIPWEVRPGTVRPDPPPEEHAAKPSVAATNTATAHRNIPITTAHRRTP